MMFRLRLVTNESYNVEAPSRAAARQMIKDAEDSGYGFLFRPGFSLICPPTEYIRNFRQVPTKAKPRAKGCTKP